MSRDKANTVCFGEFRLEPRTLELTRDGHAIPLERQPAMVLSRLLAAPGEVVSREELATLLWGADTHVNYDDGLNYCIRRIRAALEDDPRAPTFVATLPRLGYRFIAQVTPDSGLAERQRRWLAPAALAAALALLTFAIESRPNQHHEIAVSLLRSLHDLAF
jgi:DNA-binding winged helix-turn-helix (wHTH) protein